MSFTLHLGDCRAVLATLEADSVDACITDPPYELGFMGKAWDKSGVAFDVETWRAVLRVLKPGGHLLAFGGTRTIHRIACAIEDAGFDIRDQLSWLYGSGFPKSLDVSKAIDAAAGAEREVIGLKIDAKTGKPMSAKQARRGGKGVTDGWDRPCLASPEFIAANISVTAPATDGARMWAGWGTALKPACEPIVLARKPLVGTVAANVLAHGTGALNIDSCRIGVLPDDAAARDSRNGATSRGKIATSVYGDYSASDANRTGVAAGRWPANVLLDEEAAAMLDEQSGVSKSTGGGGRHEAGDDTRNGIYGRYGARDLPANVGKGDSGGASRFFYVAKASRKERDFGCEHLPPRNAGEATDREEGSDGLNSPRAGAGRTGGAKNYHPTVKPVTLMRYLVRLVTPKGGVVLDPFTGSGTTGVAAIAEGFKFIGIEREEEYRTIAEARINTAVAQLVLFTEYRDE